MKDRLILLIASVVCAVGAWGFWHYSGQWGFLVLLVGSYATLLADNYRLRMIERSGTFLSPKRDLRVACMDNESWHFAGTDTRGPSVRCLGQR